MKISLFSKNLILIIFTVIFLLVCIGIVYFFFLEKRYFEQKETEYMDLARGFSLDYDGSVQESYDLIDEMEDKYGLNVIIADQLGIIQYTTVIKGNPWGGTAARWKNDNVYIPPDIRQKLISGETAIYYSRNEKFGTELLNVAAPLMNSQILILEAELGHAKNVLEYMSKYYVITGMGALLLTFAIAYLISLKVAMPVSKLRYIAKRMAESDYSVKYTDDRNDEIDEIGESLNILSTKLESYSRQISGFNSILRDSVEKEKHSERKRQEFLSNVSRELKTPVSIIKDFATRLKKGRPSDSEETIYYYKVIEEEAVKMTDLISELLEISKLDKNGEYFNAENFDIISLIKNVTKRYEKEIAEKKIKYILCTKYDSITVRGDPYRIEQVVTNMLTNAIKHAGNEKGIAIKLEKGQTRTLVKVFNTGENIPCEDLDRIWESFYRTGGETVREKGSTGLGLYIVKKILTMHKAGFGVRNIKGGVEFWFDIENF